MRDHLQQTTLADLRARWRHILRGLSEPDVELTAEEFAPLLSTFRLLTQSGEAFDPMLTALVNVLARQAMETDDDVDLDDADDFLDLRDLDIADRAREVA